MERRQLRVWVGVCAVLVAVGAAVALVVPAAHDQPPERHDAADVRHKATLSADVHRREGRDVGPHGDLPRLLPTVEPAWASVDHASFAGQTWRLRKVPGSGPAEEAAYDVVETRGGVVRFARVPRGWAPRIFPDPVALGRGTTGLLLSQEGGDSDTWRVYVDRGGRVQQVAVRGPVSLGGGFADGDTAYLSWLTPPGRLFTRVGTEQPGRYRVYSWQPTGGDATTPPTLVAHDLGTVCIDEMVGTYGTCR